MGFVRFTNKVDVDEWNEKSKGRKLPEKAKKKRK